MSELKEQETGVVWCKPWGEGQGDYVRVNVADFDPAFHVQLDDANGDGKVSARERKAAAKAKD